MGPSDDPSTNLPLANCIIAFFSNALKGRASDLTKMALSNARTRKMWRALMALLMLDKTQEGVTRVDLYVLV